MGNVKKDMLAPDFTLKDLAQTSVTLSQLRGHKVVLMDFWATWCPPCKMEMPLLQDMQDKLKGRDFEILSIDQGETSEQVGYFIKAKKYGFHVLLDSDGAVGGLYGVPGIPTLVLVDKKGVIQSLQVGYNGDEDALEKEVERLLKE
jgi:peroxiredoxin